MYAYYPDCVTEVTIVLQAQAMSMTYEEFSSDLPRHGTLGFTSAEQTEAVFKSHGVHQPMRQLARGRYRADLAVRSTEQADLFADRYNVACSIYLEPPAGAVALLFFRSAGGRFLASGESVANDKLVVMPRGSGSDLVTPDLFGSDAMTVPEARFIELTELLCATPKSVRPERVAVIQGDTGQLQALRRTLLELLAHPELDRNQERVSNLLAATIDWMGRYSGFWRPERLANGARSRFARLAREFIEEHYREAVRLEDLCRASGVGVRTLQRCFREYFDLTITEYLKTVRLDAAHRELAAADPVRESVSSIAVQHGFSHLGRFSVEFRERFAESPRETLAARATSSP